jgi:hypothetical protein
MKGVLILSAIAATSVAATLNAQVTTGKPDSGGCKNFPDGRVECRVSRASGKSDSAFRRIAYRMDSAMAKRAALGISLRSTGTKRDTLGVFVDAVTPKGPAETAGIIEGDRIAAINGVDLRTASGDVDDSYTNGLAAHRLSREVEKLTPGSRVNLRVYSGGRFRDVQVTAGKASELMRLGGRVNFRVPGPDGMLDINPGGAMWFGPDMPMFREQIEPLMRERLKDLPNKIRLRTPMRYKTLTPRRAPMIFKMDADDADGLGPVWNEGEFDETLLPEMDDDFLDIENGIEEVTSAVIRDLAATAIRDAQSALKQLAADGVV